MAETGAQNGDTRSPALPLDDNLYTLDDETSDFFKVQTGIQDTEELKKHLLRVQAEAYAVRSNVVLHGPISCISCRYTRTHAYAGSCSSSEYLICSTIREHLDVQLYLTLAG